MAETFGSSIRSTRLQLGISQRELAKRIGCPPSTVSRWESGQTEFPSGRLLFLTRAAVKNIRTEQLLMGRSLKNILYEIEHGK
ncbi:helix-turn-helix transcriptional regulator [Actinacidiphila rubida]|uniref:Helix-turn-helix n=1 Tax=Actinacidiphila rubida TaxID=310780 RepID=A0A1H8L953_9ACTN|nr:Helix-turn-helix [Actinacidiphila rubida]